MCRIHGHLVMRGITVLNPQVVIFQVDLQVGEDQLLLDELPDDTGHLVAVELHHRVQYFDFLHVLNLCADL